MFSFQLLFHHQYLEMYLFIYKIFYPLFDNKLRTFFYSNIDGGRMVMRKNTLNHSCL